MVLAKAGAAGLHKYFTADYVIGDSEDHIINIQTVYFMLKLSTDNGDAEGCIEPFAATTDGHDVWQAIKKKYEGDEIPGELAKTLRRQLRNLQLTSKDDALLFMNKFELLSNQLEKIGRKQTQETLVDMIYDAVVDPRYNISIGICKQFKSQYKTVASAFEAICAANSDNTREQLGGLSDTSRGYQPKGLRITVDTNGEKPPLGYRT